MNSGIKNGSKMNMICMINVPNYYHLYSNQNNASASLLSYRETNVTFLLYVVYNNLYFMHKNDKKFTACYPIAPYDKGCPKRNKNYS